MRSKMFYWCAVALGLFAVACSQHTEVTTENDTNNPDKGIAVPSSITAAQLPSGTLVAYLYMDQETDTPLASRAVDYSNAQSSVKFENIPVSPGEHTFTISFKFQSPSIQLITLASETTDVLDLQPGSSTPIVFEEGDYFYPDEDEDFISNLMELENGTNPRNDDVTAPDAQNFFPVGGAVDIPINANVVVEFSEALQGLSVNNSSFMLEGPEGPVLGTVSYSVNSPFVVLFAPSEYLLENTTYTATLTTAIKDVAGNRLVSDHVWSFTTALDNTPPQVTNTTPSDSSTDIALVTPISVDFSEALDSSTVSSQTVRVEGPDGVVQGTISYLDASPYTVSFAPSNALQSNSLYSITLAPDIMDISGNNLAAEYTWSFTTTSDLTPPQAQNPMPSDNSFSIPLDAVITVEFSEALNPSTISNSAFTLQSSQGIVQGAVSYIEAQPYILSFTPASNLERGVRYTATVSEAIEDLGGNTLVTDFVWSFTTIGFDHAGITQSCNSCHDSVLAIGKHEAHIATEEDCGICHNTSSFIGVVIDHADPQVVSIRCDSCHNDLWATGLTQDHIPTTSDCRNCHYTRSFLVSYADHTNIVDNCISCHDGVQAIGKNSGHFVTTEDCSVCHLPGTFVTAQSATSLKFTFKNNSRDMQLASGVSVALYNSDNVTIANNGVLTSGTDGVVNFGEIGRDTATFTIVYSTAQGQQVRSYINAPVAYNVIYLDDSIFSDGFGCTDTNSVASINVNLTNVPGTASSGAIAPFGTFVDLQAGLQNQPVCEESLQSDGSISLLGSASDSQGTVLSYGYLLDQTVTDGTTYSIPVNRIPATVGYITSPATPSYVNILALRDNVSYSVGFNSFLSGPVASGNLLVATDFPADSYFEVASSSSTQTSNLTSYTTLSRRSFLLQMLIFNYADTTIENLAVSLNPQAVNWTVSGTSPVDYVSIGIYDLSSSTNWSITMPSDSVSWQRMELPAPANLWMNQGLSNYDVYVSLTDIDVIIGYTKDWDKLHSIELFNSFNVMQISKSLIPAVTTP